LEERYIMNKIKKFLAQISRKIKPYLSVRGFLSMGIAWLITNGWSWVFIVLGPILKIGWMTKVGIGYQAILWMPFTIEKPITFAIGVWLHKILFGTEPNIEVIQDETN